MAGHSIRAILGPLHPSEDKLLQALRRHPTDPRVWLPRCHYICCSSCRRRVAEVEANDLRLFVRHQSSLDLHLPEAEQSRRRLIAAIRNQQTLSAATLPERSPKLNRIHVIGAALTAATACLLLVLYFPHRAPALSATDLLQRAVASQPLALAAPTPGVVVQRVAVRVDGHTYPMTLYRDSQGKRTPRLRSVSSEEASLGARLVAAGVSQQDPLSIISFRDWRGRLRAKSDSVTRAASGVVTISTVAHDAGSNPVRAESITLRESDLHPLSRTIEFSSASNEPQTVEIAELTYELLPWSSAGADWFESEAPTASHIHAANKPNAPAIVKAPPSDMELNLAELNLRLLLSREEADVNEQIEVKRGPSGVVARGVVSSQERKLKLQSMIASIANAHAELATPEEREAADSLHTQAITSAAPLKMVEAVSKPSPLLEYWTRLHRDPAELQELASALIDSGVKVRQQARAIRELVHEFTGKQALGTESTDAFKALLQDHTVKLQAALADQSQTLKRLNSERYKIDSGPKAVPEAGGLSTDDLNHKVELLDQEASRVMDICRRLTTGSDAAGQTKENDAVALLDELARQQSSISATLDSLDRANFRVQR